MREDTGAHEGKEEEQLFFAFFGCSIRILMRSQCVLNLSACIDAVSILTRFSYEDDRTMELRFFVLFFVVVRP